MGMFSVNLSNVQPAQRGLPAGEYVFRVTEADHKPVKDPKVPGTMRASYRCEVVQDLKGDTTLQGKSMWHGFNEDDTGAPYFVAFIGACGVQPQNGSVTDDMLTGKYFVGRVFVNNAGYTNITGERALDGSVAQTGQPRGMQGGGLLQNSGFGQAPQQNFQQSFQQPMPQPMPQPGQFPQQGMPQSQQMPLQGFPQQGQPYAPQQPMQQNFQQSMPGQFPQQGMPQGFPQGQQMPQQQMPQQPGLLPAPAPPPGNITGQK